MPQDNQQGGYLTIPIEAFSYSTRQNHEGKPFWVHLQGNSNSYVTFVIVTERGQMDLGSSAARIAYKVIHDGKELEQFRLDHLLKLASIDEKNGKLGGESDAKLNLVARKPQVAMKYTTEDFDIKRNQIKFLPHPNTGFETFCEQLTRSGLTLREPVTKSSQRKDGQPGDSQTRRIAASSQNFQATEPVTIQLPTYQHHLGAPLSLASSQTQGQRLDACRGASESQSQLHSIPVAHFPYPSQQSYQGQNQTILSHGTLPTTPAGATHTNSGMLSKQGMPDQLEQNFPSPMLDRLKQRPVGRKLSFSTPPSSGQAPSNSDTELFVESQRIQPYHHASQSPLMQHPLGSRNENLVANHRTFLQQSSPLRNETVFQPEGQAIQFASTVSGTDRALPVLDWRPATAPAYPGMAQSVTGPEEDQRPPKRILPFPPLKVSNTARVATDTNDHDVVADKFALETQSRGQMSLNRPATSPADVQTRKRAKPDQKSKTATTKKKASAASLSKKLDDAMMAFIDETELSEERQAKKPRTQSFAMQGAQVDVPLLATPKDRILPPMLDTVDEDGQSSQGRPSKYRDLAAGQIEVHREPLQDHIESTPLQAANACVACRKRRSKCDMHLPACEKCKQEGQTCDYTPPKRNRSKRTQGPASQITKQAATLPTIATATHQSIGTQASLVSFSLPSRRSASSQTALASNIDLQAPEVAVLASFMQAVDRLVSSHGGNSGPSVREAPGRAEDNERAGASPRITKEERARAMERRICQLLADDTFLKLCDEVEEVCDRTGIVI